ncbi:hypothetical protein B0T26DRAFT_108012 [Lasiosphaeria miniovina]|uniref:Uncharacterized protein n=1 Tax=Lasiosphaeria miniovina TaxID=1954250 RepID=A0AA40B3B6_9PEZI|nr:uncharacterized protein B0T26DRAFT_108012 [Lasiosphaeria miniovina]KAK0726913.1 hypothetical protein B0T26DRAFT_108012 [Lasiosphaeria miniovina]
MHLLPPALTTCFHGITTSCQPFAVLLLFFRCSSAVLPLFFCCSSAVLPLFVTGPSKDLILVSLGSISRHTSASTFPGLYRVAMCAINTTTLCTDSLSRPARRHRPSRACWPYLFAMRQTPNRPFNAARVSYLIKNISSTGAVAGEMGGR